MGVNQSEGNGERVMADRLLYQLILERVPAAPGADDGEGVSAFRRHPFGGRRQGEVRRELLRGTGPG
jgi:hypothetical protein